jgi:hypothetical protein
VEAPQPDAPGVAQADVELVAALALVDRVRKRRALRAVREELERVWPAGPHQRIERRVVGQRVRPRLHRRAARAVRPRDAQRERVAVPRVVAQLERECGAGSSERAAPLRAAVGRHRIRRAGVVQGRAAHGRRRAQEARCLEREDVRERARRAQLVREHEEERSRDERDEQADACCRRRHRVVVSVRSWSGLIAPALDGICV